MLFKNITNLYTVSLLTIRSNSLSQIAIKNSSHILQLQYQNQQQRSINLYKIWTRYYSFINSNNNNNKRNILYNIFKNNLTRNNKNVIVKRCKTSQTTNGIGTTKPKIISSLKKEKNLADKNLKINASDIRRLFSLAKNEKWILIAAIGCLIVSSAITLSVPYALGKILDIIFQENIEAKEMLRNFCLILGGVFIVGGMANFGRVYLFNSACKLIFILFF